MNALERLLFALYRTGQLQVASVDTPESELPSERGILEAFGDSGSIWVSQTGRGPILRVANRALHNTWLQENNHPLAFQSQRILMHLWLNEMAYWHAKIELRLFGVTLDPP